MFVNNIFAVLLVQAEARNHGWLSGFLDSMMDLASLSATAISVTVLQGHNTRAKGLILLAITLANFAGSKLGVNIGKRYIKEEVRCTCCPLHKEHI